MKHFFVINVASGDGSGHPQIVAEIERVLSALALQGELHRTLCQKDALVYVKRICKDHPNDSLRFYACGGDGTINEVVNGMKGHPDASLALIPCGTGNDFAANFAAYQTQPSIESLVDAPTQKVDLMDVNGYRTVNVCHVGLDAQVAFNMTKMKSLPFVKGALAYYLSVFYSLLQPIGVELEVCVDKHEKFRQKFLLLMAANGKQYGGGFQASPFSDTTDGILNFCGCQVVPRMMIARLVNAYKRGEHLTDPLIKQFFCYRECKSVVIKSKSPLRICCDGEKMISRILQIQVAKHALNLVLPQ